MVDIAIKWETSHHITGLHQTMIPKNEEWVKSTTDHDGISYTCSKIREGTEGVANNEPAESQQGHNKISYLNREEPRCHCSLQLL
jgi:hypothetical protein